MCAMVDFRIYDRWDLTHTMTTLIFTSLLVYTSVWHSIYILQHYNTSILVYLIGILTLVSSNSRNMHEIIDLLCSFVLCFLFKKQMSLTLTDWFPVWEINKLRHKILPKPDSNLNLGITEQALNHWAMEVLEKSCFQAIYVINIS